LKNKSKWDKFYTDFSLNAIRTIPGGANLKKTDKELLEDAVRLLNDINDSGKRQITQTFINCWYENEYESEAMWKLYTSSLNQGIAVKTTLKRLYRSLYRNPDIKIGRVNYIDYGNQFAGINEAFWFKRKSFEHEREVRAVIKDFRAKDEVGKLVPIDVEILIEKVYLSPTSASWFKELVNDVMQKYNFKKPILVSDMTALPFH
jgi:hypothetical protein